MEGGKTEGFVREDYRMDLGEDGLGNGTLSRELLIGKKKL